MEELIKQARAGNMQAFKKLYQRKKVPALKYVWPCVMTGTMLLKPARMDLLIFIIIWKICKIFSISIPGSIELWSMRPMMSSIPEKIKMRILTYWSTWKITKLIIIIT